MWHCRVVDGWLPVAPTANGGPHEPNAPNPGYDYGGEGGLD